MNRSPYFDCIEFKLTSLATSLELRGGLNILNEHLHAENFYIHFCKVLWDWDLENLNARDQNAAGVDLVDQTRKIIVQVSATATKQKVESALAKDLSAYSGYTFKFISISKDARVLRATTFSNPHKLTFSPAKDIIDIPSLLREILPMNMERLKEICDFLKKELKSETDPEKVESNLTTIIKILSKQDWGQGVVDFEVIPYEIEPKILHNKLDTARVLIDDYKIHYHRIDRIYSEFDKQGVNKSISIFNGIRTEYLALGEAASPDKRFFSVVDKVKGRIQSSANYTPLPDEELELCVQILVVDAFIRCKIFKNPLVNTDAHS